MKINPDFIEKVLTRFIHDELDKCGFPRGILGLSGGLDSTVCAYLAVRAIGSENVQALIMPYGSSFSGDVKDAGEVARILGVKSKTIDISPQIDAYFALFPAPSQVLKGNKMARERMSILYDHSAREKALVLGTSNKTELLIGYGTIHGDMACAINPLGDLYKTQVRELGAHLGIPEKILKKQPTAGLWPGQTDEGEIGATYAEIDAVLFEMVDQRKSKQELLAQGFQERLVEKIAGMIRNSNFKRTLPPIARISSSTIGHNPHYRCDPDK